MGPLLDLHVLVWADSAVVGAVAAAYCLAVVPIGSPAAGSLTDDVLVGAAAAVVAV